MTLSPPLPHPKPLPKELAVLPRTLQVQALDTAELRDRAQALLVEHHYLGGVQAVGEQVHYAVTDARGGWVAVLIFAAAAWHLRPRDEWIGWTDEQRRQRLALVTNNVRFLLLPDRTVPNLGSAVLSRALARLSDDWQARYDHPVLVVETFVDPERFQGGVYRASGWIELGRTKGHGRIARDYYEDLDRPKLLFVRELVRNARRNLQAEQIKPALAAVKAKVPVRGDPPAEEIVVLDGKVPKHSGGLNVVSAVTAPNLYYLGSEVVAEKTNEIPAVRTLCQRIELTGRLVSIDALHTQTQTAREIVMEHGGDILMTVKGNQPTVPRESVSRRGTKPPDTRCLLDADNRRTIRLGGGPRHHCHDDSDK
ncbi:MAG: ISAs1 family transposase [Opitutaceae bacterium]|nr:ISAs1 family transposase [Opitutaceae bacterium]